MPDRRATEAVLCRVDDFTPAAFVSHTANRTAKELEEIDLLPRIRGRTMLTKELAPLFCDNEKEQRQSFARLTSVLDGNGYKTSSGTHGMRGCEGPHIFHWIGATTPIPERTYRVMSQLGNRLLFYGIEGPESTEDELMNFARNYDGNDDVEACRKVVNDFLEEHFKKCPVDSIDPGDVAIAEEELRRVVRCAQLIAHGRVEVTRGKWGGEFEAGAPEGP